MKIQSEITPSTKPPVEKPISLSGEKRKDKPARHMALCEEINAIYTKKNHDYGDSFHATYLEEGMAMARIRLSDKLNRFKTLTRKKDAAQVNDESVRDTLLDLANYALMTVLEMDEEEGRK